MQWSQAWADRAASSPGLSAAAEGGRPASQRHTPSECALPASVAPKRGSPVSRHRSSISGSPFSTTTTGMTGTTSPALVEADTTPKALSRSRSLAGIPTDEVATVVPRRDDDRPHASGFALSVHRGPLPRPQNTVARVSRARFVTRATRQSQMVGRSQRWGIITTSFGRQISGTCSTRAPRLTRLTISGNRVAFPEIDRLSQSRAGTDGHSPPETGGCAVPTTTDVGRHYPRCETCAGPFS